MKDAKTEEQDFVESFGYVGGSARGDRCLINVQKVVVPMPETTSVAKTSHGPA